MNPPTDLTRYRIAPERMSWRDKVASQALGLLAVLFLAVLGFGVVGLWRWLVEMITILKGFL